MLSFFVAIFTAYVLLSLCCVAVIAARATAAVAHGGVYDAETSLRVHRVRVRAHQIYALMSTSRRYRRRRLCRTRLAAETCRFEIAAVLGVDWLSSTAECFFFVFHALHSSKHILYLSPARAVQHKKYTLNVTGL